MSGIKNVRSKTCSYSVVLQIFFRLEKFIQYSKSQKNKEMHSFNQINDKYLEAFSSNLRNQNFMSFIDPFSFYNILDINYELDNVMNILSDFVDLFRKKMGEMYDELYIDFTILNGHSVKEKKIPYYSMHLDKNFSFYDNFINSTRFFDDFILTLPVISILEFVENVDFLPNFSIELEDSLSVEKYIYKLKGIILYKNKHWAISFLFNDTWYIFNDKKVIQCDEFYTVDDMLEEFKISGAIYIKDKYYNDNNFFNNNLIFDLNEDLKSPSSSYIENSNKSSQIYFNFNFNDFDSLKYSQTIKYRNVNCILANKFLLPDVKFPIEEDNYSKHFFSEFFKKHPFLYHYLYNSENITFEQLLIDFKITLDDFNSFSDTYNYYNTLNDENLNKTQSFSKLLTIKFDKNNISNNAYEFWESTKENFDERYIEILYYGNISIFEFNLIKSLFDSNDFIGFLPGPIISLEKTPKNVFNLDEKYDNGFLKNYVDNIPEFIKNLDFMNTDYINQNLSLVFLGADIRYENMGLSSGKLHGTTFSNIRRFNTGFILMSSESNDLTSKMKEIKGDVLEVFNYLKENNPLYENFIIPESQINFNDWVFSSVDKFRSKNGILITNQDDDNSFLFKIVDGEKLIRITVSTEIDNAKYLYVTFEEALALMFPVLFPNGPIPKINAKTFRQKAKILLSCKYFRIGLVACSMILYIYDIIIRDENNTFQKCVKKVRVQKPDDETGDGTDIKISANDPAFHLYWYNRNIEVTAMTEQFGPPDLMLTFTFNNNWEEVYQFIEKNYRTYTNKKYYFEIQFSPVDEMIFWNDRFHEFSKNDFNDILEIAGLGKCKHYFRRLEFQGRGAPHAHCLIWLNELLNIEKIDKHIYANFPEKICNNTYSAFTKYMTHHCSPSNCFKNGVSCRFGFPKQSVTQTHYNDEGFLELKRNNENKNTVDYCPMLIVQTNSHTHINVLRSEEMPLGSPNGIHYVLKYNFKPEPNMVIEGQKISDKVRFKARIVSCEEAVARILSFSFSEKSIGSVFIDTVPPSLRTAIAIKNGKQKQIDIIEKYYCRPSYLDRLTILEFFSLYHIVNSKTENIIEPPDKNLIERPQNSLIIGSNWELDNLTLDQSIQTGFLYKSDKLPDANRLQFNKLITPRIVTFWNFDFIEQEKNFYYHYLLISGCWRSEEEMMAGFDDPIDSINYHGLVLPKIPNINPGVELYLLYHIKWIRFDENKIQKIIANFINQGISSESLLTILKRNLSIYLNPIKSRILNSINYIKDIASLILEENSVSRKSFEIPNDSIKKYITINCSQEEIDVSQKLSGAWKVRSFFLCNEYFLKQIISINSINV